MQEMELTDFKGTEQIFYRSEEVFRQNYVERLILPK